MVIYYASDAVLHQIALSCIVIPWVDSSQTSICRCVMLL